MSTNNSREIYAQRQAKKRFPQFQGSLPALLTPFTAGGAEVWTDLLVPHLDWVAAQGASGALLLGTNGEGPSLSTAEKKAVIFKATTMSAFQDRHFHLLAGTATSSLPEAIDIGDYALAQGVDGLLIVPPFYYKNPEPRGLFAWYSALFSQLPEAPLFLYNIPQFSAINISLELLSFLDERFPTRLAGVKDSTGRPELIESYVNRFPHLTILAGSDAHVAASLAKGASGVITSCGNIVPELVYRTFSAFSLGEDPLPAQAKLSAVRALFERFSMVPLNKYIVHRRTNLPLSFVRPPLCDLSGEDGKLLDQELRTLGLL